MSNDLTVEQINEQIAVLNQQKAEKENKELSQKLVTLFSSLSQEQIIQKVIEMTTCNPIMKRFVLRYLNENIEQ